MKLLERLEEQIKILRISKKEYSKRLSDLKDKNNNLFNSIKIITEEQKELVKKYDLLNVKLVKASDSMRLKSQSFQSKIVKQMHREDSNE